MTILINHMGYRVGHPKSLVVQDQNNQAWQSFQVRDVNDSVVLSGALQQVGKVAHWHTGHYWMGDFSQVNTAGTYTITITGPEHEETSEAFVIDHGQTNLRLISALTYYFKGQRDSGEWAAADQSAPFSGQREGRHNIDGGWFDATGDLGIHMSHQTFTSYFNPQQLPFSVYAFFQAYELLAGKSPNFTMVKRHLLDEGTFGADALVRRYVEGRSFLKSVNRETAYSIVDTTRKIGFELHRSSWQFGEASTLDEEAVTDLNYETSFRSGGGLGIAALAIAARHPYTGAKFPVEQYLHVAKRVYAYLQNHNNEINNDGRTNLVDEYCAAYAAVELYRTTGEYGYLLAAEAWAQAILKRIANMDGHDYFTVDQDLPFFHPSDEGMPLIALCQVAQLTDKPDLRAALIAGVQRVYRGLQRLTAAVNNPFDYPRLLIRGESGYQSQFFFPHQSAAAPWWQGENARIASLAVASLMAAQLLDQPNEKFAQQQIDWILGKNPFDSTMMEGYGRHPIQYHFNDRLDFINAPGGVVNGITSGIEDEEDIAFIAEPTEAVADNWRWAEQWIPHASWLLVLLAASEDTVQK